MVEMSTMYGITNEMRDITNKQASEFFNSEDNYRRLLEAARKFGAIAECVEDVVHDVYLSYVRNEMNGEGFDSSKGKEEIDGEISLEEAIFGRLKRYCMNTKYRYTWVKKKRKEKDKDKEIEVMPASIMEADNQSMFQYVYATAESYDNLEQVEQEIALAEELQYIIEYEKSNSVKIGVSVKSILMNIECLLDNTETLDSTLFEGIKHTSEEFKETLKSVIRYAVQMPDKYRRIINDLALLE